MGLTMVQRQAVTKTIATRYKRADRAGKQVDPGRVVRDDRLASGPCAQGASGRAHAADRAASAPRAPV